MFFTIMTPSYNRAHTLHRVYESLCAQGFKDFEWIIIDDGSTDNTKTLVEEYITEKKLDTIRYVKKSNQGKVAAINDALKISRGEWFVVFDSDDWCVGDALAQIHEAIKILDYENTLQEYAAISCLKAYASGEIVGEDYTRMKKHGESYIDRFNRKIRGDKWEIIRTEIHKNNNYDIDGTEKYMPPEYAWLKIGTTYKTMFLNKPLSIIEYQDDGISKNNIRHRAGSPLSTARYYSLAENLASNSLMRHRCLINKKRFLLHARENSFPITPATFIAYLLYCMDRVRVATMQKRSRQPIPAMRN